MDRLPHTWDAMLSRFGRFTEIQTKAIDPLLAGKNCVLVSATASGKTEAALAPILERQLQISNRQSAIGNVINLFIVPTRALTRDLLRRLDQPLKKLALNLSIKTGDETALKQNRSHDVLLTTPESFDSLLANRPRMLRNVHAVILDELHLYADSARGDQLQILLNRLRRLRKFAFEKGDALTETIQFCALSATIENPLQMASHYFKDPLVIESRGQREIDEELFGFENTNLLRNLFAQLSVRGVKKVLAFCQSRAECESFAYNFKNTMPFGERVYAHHANLSAKVRHDIEDKFTKLDSALCFATTTLELGIDIGDVDLILLIGAPNDAASFLQRIGRGNRRTQRTNVVCFYRDEREHALFRIFLRSAKTGKHLQSNAAAPFRPSVVVQQLFSYVKQTRNGEIEPNHAYELFSTPQGEPLLSKQHYNQIIERLLKENYFAPSFGTLIKPALKWQELYERREIYTNIGDDQNAIEVIDEMTGRKIGYINNPITQGSTFLFGGQSQRAARRDGKKLFVNPANERAKTVHGGKSFQPLSPELVRALALELGIPIQSNTLPMILDEAIEDAPQRALLLHCAGFAYGLVLGDLLEKSFDCTVEECDELSLSINFNEKISALNFNQTEIASAVQKRWQQFEKWYSSGRWQKLLPASVRAAHVITSFQTEKFQQMFSQSNLRIENRDE